jgi:transposase
MTCIYLREKTRKGHRYWSVVEGRRSADRVVQEQRIHLGRLDDLRPLEVSEKLARVRSLGDPTLVLKFNALLSELGYTVPPSLASFDLRTVRSYGPELALFRLAEELDLIALIDSRSPKGGGPALGKMTVALAIYANRRPGSMWRFVEWYRRSSLPIFLDLPPAQVTYDASLNTLDYLQPERTRAIEAETYARVRKRYGYRCERIFIDSTPQELAGELCRVIAKFGRSKSGGVSKRRQITITFLVDQKGVLLGHEVFPGNKNDSKTMAPVNRRLREGYGEEVRGGARVTDRGYGSPANVRAMKRRKERFLMALLARPKSLKLLDEIGVPHQRWKEVADGVRAASVVRERVRWVVIWNDEVAKRNGDGREAKMRKARDELAALAKAAKEGRVKSRAERDRRAGAIIRNHGAGRFLRIRGARKGFGFAVEETGKAEEKAEHDGYTVFATSETDMTEKEVFDSYRARDLIEKAIRTMKSVLGLGPVRLTKMEHVLGHMYVHALAYQLRAVMALRLKEAKADMTPEEALWEMERLQVAELVVKGEEIAVIRKITRMDGTLESLAHVFRLAGKDGLPGVDGGI